jgi:hypothetical protein
MKKQNAAFSTINFWNMYLHYLLHYFISFNTATRNCAAFVSLVDAKNGMLHVFERLWFDGVSWCFHLSAKHDSKCNMMCFCYFACVDITIWSELLSLDAHFALTMCCQSLLIFLLLVDGLIQVKKLPTF